LVAFQLPENTIVKTYYLDKTISLNTNSGFKPFGLNVNLNLTKSKTVLFIYNVNLKTDGAKFTVRLKMGNKYNRKSVLTVKELSYGRGTGYVVRVLLKGNYNFDLDYNTDSKNIFNPETPDSQTVSLQVVEMD
jgi:hypothetical protein